MDHKKLWKILKEMGIPYHLTCLLRNLYASQEATVRTGRGTMDWIKIGKGVSTMSKHLTCLLRNLYAGQEEIVRTSNGAMDWFNIGEEVWQGYILSPGLFSFYAEYIMQNGGVDESQGGIKISRRNINNLRYADIPL